jgi:hypothetical protein
VARRKKADIVTDDAAKSNRAGSNRRKTLTGTRRLKSAAKAAPARKPVTSRTKAKEPADPFKGLKVVDLKALATRQAKSLDRAKLRAKTMKLELTQANKHVAELESEVIQLNKKLKKAESVANKETDRVKPKRQKKPILSEAKSAPFETKLETHEEISTDGAFEENLDQE